MPSLHTGPFPVRQSGLPAFSAETRWDDGRQVGFISGTSNRSVPTQTEAGLGPARRAYEDPSWLTYEMNGQMPKQRCNQIGDTDVRSDSTPLQGGPLCESVGR